jgi:hypothetical protein
MTGHLECDVYRDIFICAPPISRKVVSVQSLPCPLSSKERKLLQSSFVV